MPKVGKTEFAYSKAGKKAAKELASATGQKVSYFGGGSINAMDRSQFLDFNKMYKKGGKVKEK
jgi:uncharacterized cupin superfamily protein